MCIWYKEAYIRGQNLCDESTNSMTLIISEMKRCDQVYNISWIKMMPIIGKTDFSQQWDAQHLFTGWNIQQPFLYLNTIFWNYILPRQMKINLKVIFSSMIRFLCCRDYKNTQLSFIAAIKYYSQINLSDFSWAKE